MREMRRRDEEASVRARDPVQGLGLVQDGLRGEARGVIDDGFFGNEVRYEDGIEDRDEERDQGRNEKRIEDQRVNLTMAKAKDFKRRADSVLEDVFRALFEEIDTEKLKKEIDELRSKAPDYSQNDHARVVARRTAIRCAAAGAVTGLPLGIAAIATIGADLAYLMHQQFRLILAIAAVYGHDLSNRERFSEAVSCFAYTTGVGVGKEGIAVGTRLLRD